MTANDMVLSIILTLFKYVIYDFQAYGRLLPSARDSQDCQRGRNQGSAFGKINAWGKGYLFTNPWPNPKGIFDKIAKVTTLANHYTVATAEAVVPTALLEPLAHRSLI
jgi:hypothetical protein